MPHDAKGQKLNENIMDLRFLLCIVQNVVLYLFSSLKEEKSTLLLQHHGLEGKVNLL